MGPTHGVPCRRAICHQPMIEHYLNEKNKKEKICGKIFSWGKTQKVSVDFRAFKKLESSLRCIRVFALVMWNHNNVN